MKIIFVIACLLSMVCANSIAADKKSHYLSDKHASHDVKCVACHVETGKKKKVPMQQCLKCHVSYPALVEKTRNFTFNPHTGHMGALPCTTCHHGNRPTENLCLSCHSK